MDYSRFDHIDTDSDEEGAGLSSAAPSGASSAAAQGLGAPAKMTKKGKDGRLKFEFGGRTIYEWEQSLEEVQSICLILHVFKSVKQIR
jgi:hypothetical protein